MNYKYLVDKGSSPDSVMLVEVNELDDGDNSRKLKVFPYDQSWWAKQDVSMRKSLEDFEPMSSTLNDAVNKARAFYDSLPLEPAPQAKSLIGRID